MSQPLQRVPAAGCPLLCSVKSHFSQPVIRLENECRLLFLTWRPRWFVLGRAAKQEAGKITTHTLWPPAVNLRHPCYLHPFQTSLPFQLWALRQLRGWTPSLRTCNMHTKRKTSLKRNQHVGERKFWVLVTKPKGMFILRRHSCFRGRLWPAQVHIPALLLSICTTIASYFTSLCFMFSSIKWDSKSTNLIELLWGLNELIYSKCLKR